MLVIAADGIHQRNSHRRSEDRQSGLDKRNFNISVCVFVSSLYTERTNTATKIRCIAEEGETDWLRETEKEWMNQRKHPWCIIINISWVLSCLFIGGLNRSPPPLSQALIKTKAQSVKALKEQITQKDCRAELWCQHDWQNQIVIKAFKFKG